MIETSVIIPTYNRLEFVKEAVASVLAQTYQDFEVILVDDGSNDGTADYAETLGGHIKFLFQDNQGPSAARNNGIKAAAGKFITFLDSDDLWHRDKLMMQIDFMNSNKGATVCYTDEIWVRRGVRVNPRRKHRKYSGWIFERCLPLCIVSPSSVLMRKEFFDRVGLFDEDLPACEDYDLWLRGALHFPFDFLQRHLITKRGGHHDQLSAQWGLDVYRVRALRKLLDSGLLSTERRRLVINQAKEKCRILVQGFRKRAKEREAIRYSKILEELSQIKLTGVAAEP